VLFVIFYFNTKGNIIYDKLLDTTANNTEDQLQIKYSDNKASLANPTNNFTLSLWFYIENWEVGQSNKNILYMSDTITDPYSESSPSSDKPDLGIYMDKYKNELYINLKQKVEGDDAQRKKYEIKNIHIQRWNCLTISVDSHVLDAYMNGKLINSFIIESYFHKDHSNPNIYLGPIGDITSIQGYITRIRYYTNYISSQEAYNIYKEGISQSILTKMSNSYSLDFGLIENGTRKAGFRI
tara:strand:+ start:34 stop:750 length:717 start_codon:yes stop_codon:yes gene_type:complete